MILNLALAILFTIAVINMVLGVSGFYASVEATNTAQIYVNGSATTISVTDVDYSLSFDLTTGILGLVAIVIATALAFGVTALGSGLKNTTVKVLTSITVYMAIWGLLSISAYNFITGIPTIGLVLYACLTVMYVVGLIQKTVAGGGDEGEE